MSRAQIFFAILGVFLAIAGLVMALARTPPHDAISNLSKWVEWVGVRRIPAWLRDKNADTVAHKWAGAVVLVSILGMILSGAVWLIEPNAVIPVENPAHVEKNPLSIFHLTPDQRRRFASAAISPPGGPHEFVITISGMCQDCQVFADNIRQILNDLPGWNVYPSNMFGTPLIIQGIEIVVTDRNNQPPSAVVIEQAFQNADIPFHIREDKYGPPKSIHVKTPNVEFQIFTGPL